MCFWFVLQSIRLRRKQSNNAANIVHSGLVGGYWPNKLPIRLAALWDGTIPLKNREAMRPKDFDALKTFSDKQRSIDSPYDLVIMSYLRNKTKGKQRTIQDILVRPVVPWWLESFYQINPYFDTLLSHSNKVPQGAKYAVTYEKD